MKTYKVTVKYECEIDYDVEAESKDKAEKNILNMNVTHAKYTDYRQFNRKIIKQKDKTPAEI